MQNGVKLTIIINGRGGVGKDTMCEFASHRYNVVNRSSVDPIKMIAREYGGWSGGKTDKDRKFLSDLKQVFVDYNDLPTRYLVGEHKKFLAGDGEIMFMHIREPEEIAKAQRALGGECKTLLITGRKENKTYGNKSDDNVENYHYDYVYHNVKPLDEAEEDFLRFLGNMIRESEAEAYPHEF